MKPRPNLCYILKGYPRVSESFISNEILLLEEQGFDICIASMRAPRELFTHESVKRIKAKVLYLPELLLQGLPRLAWNNLAYALKRPGKYAAGLKVLLDRLQKTKNRSATLKHFLQAGYLCNKLLEGSEITHLHAHFAHSPTSVAVFASALSGLAYSFTAHAKDIYTQAKESLAEKMRNAAFVVTCTEYNRYYLKSLTNGDCQVHRVYHGIDLRLFSPSSGPDLKEPYRLLSVARLTPKKGLATVFKALAELEKQGLDFSYALIGEGEQRSELEELAGRLGISRRITWLGSLAHEDVLKWYAASHVFVIGCEVSANGDRDGIPNVLAESMAMGLPLVATRVSAIPELVEHGREGLLVEPGDHLGLAEAVRRLLTDAKLRRELSQNARTKVEAVFDNSLLAQDLASVLSASQPR